jgi:hypothetical protein
MCRDALLKTLLLQALLVIALPVAQILCAEEVQNSEPPPPVQFQVLEQRTIDLGDHSLTIQRIAPPPPSAARPAPAAPQPAPGAVQEDSRREQFLSLSATVYDGEVTRLRWFHEGREYRAFSNIDFRYLAGLGAFETADAVYSLILGLGEETRAQAAADRSRALAGGAPPDTVPPVPALAEFPAGRAAYRLTPGSAAAPPEALAALDALHRHFDAHRTGLIVRYHQRLAAQAERERQLRENPPVKKDTIFRYWRRPSPANPGAAQ